MSVSAKQGFTKSTDCRQKNPGN